MSFSRKLAKTFGVEKAAAKLLGKMHPHDGSRVEGCDYCDNPRIDRIVFICGLHRSGTTLLERMIAADYDVSYLRANVPESEGQHMQRVFPPASDYGGPGRFAFSAAMAEQLDTLNDHARHRQDILAAWSRFVVGNSGILLEKSPPNLTKIDWLRRTFPHSHFIIMTRDPRAVAGATQKWSKTPLAELVRHWDAAHAQALEQMQADDCTHVRYEDLVEQPDRELERLALAAELPKRASPEGLDKRHSSLVNTNERYNVLHGDADYGAGVWQDFGYEF